MSDGEALPSQEQRGRVFRTEVSAGLLVQLLQELTCACDAKTIRAPVGRPLVESEGMEGGSSGTSGSRMSQTSAHAHRWLCFGPPRRASRPAGETPEVREASTEQSRPVHPTSPHPLFPKRRLRWDSNAIARRRQRRARQESGCLLQFSQPGSHNRGEPIKYVLDFG